MFWNEDYAIESEAIEQVTKVITGSLIPGPPNLKKVSETVVGNSLSVQTHHLDVLVRSCKLKESFSTQRWQGDQQLDKALTHNDLGSGVGHASRNCKMDGYSGFRYHNNMVPTGVVECKNNVFSPAEGIPEGIAHATNVAIGLLNHGIPCEQIVVPVVCTTSRLFQVAAVYLLPPTCPVACFVTDILDLNVEENRKTAATAFLRMVGLTKRYERMKVRKPQRPHQEMLIDRGKYYLKSFNKIFCRFGKSGAGELDKSIARIFQICADKELRRFQKISLPIAVKLRIEGQDAAPAMIFANHHDYQSGLPADKTERGKLLEAVNAAVTEFHNLRFVHFDLYLSNILWKRQDDKSYDVKIIDLDTLHREGEEIEGQEMTTKLRDMGHRERLFFFSEGRAHRVFDLLFLRAVRENQDDEELRVRGEDEEHLAFLCRINERCRQLTADSNLIDGLLDEFAQQK